MSQFTICLEQLSAVTSAVTKASATKAVPIVSNMPTITPNMRFMTATPKLACAHGQTRSYQPMFPNARYTLALLKPVRLMMAGTVSPDSRRTDTDDHELIAQALQAANAKARDLGWIV